MTKPDAQCHSPEHPQGCGCHEGPVVSPIEIALTASHDDPIETVMSDLKAAGVDTDKFNQRVQEIVQRRPVQTNPDMKSPADWDRMLDELEQSYKHHQAVQARGHSTFIKENGRHGGSPWAEMMDAIKAVCERPVAPPTPPAEKAEFDVPTSPSVADVKAGGGEERELAHGMNCSYYDPDIGCTCALEERKKIAALMAECERLRGMVRRAQDVACELMKEKDTLKATLAESQKACDAANRRWDEQRDKVTHFQMALASATTEIERLTQSRSDIVAAASFALWGQPAHKTQAAEADFKRLMVEAGLDWNGDTQQEAK